MGPIEISFYPAGVSKPSRPCFSDGRKFGKSRNFKLKKLWSDLVVQRVLIPPPESSPRDLSNGHGFRGPCFNGVRKSLVFHDFWTVFFTDFMKRLNEHVRISIFRAENDTKKSG